MKLTIKVYFAIFITMDLPVSGIEYRLDLFALFMLLGIVQGLFLSFIFLFKKGHKQGSNIFFGLLLLSLTLSMSEDFLDYTRYMINVISLLSFANPLAFVCGPLLFLYIYTQLYGNIRLKWLHFIPFVIFSLFHLFFFNLQSDAFKYNTYIRWYYLDLPTLNNTNTLDYWFALSIKSYYTAGYIVQIGIYLLSSLFYLLKYLKESGVTFFSIKNTQIKWLQNLILIFLFMLIINMFIKIFVRSNIYDYIGDTLLSCLMYFISFNYIAHSSFFTKDGLLNGKYAKSSLSDTIKQELLHRITQLMENEKLFKDSLFSLTKLSKKLGTSTNHVSQVINECLNLKFIDFVAIYRINEAKRLLIVDDYKNLTIEQIAYEVGYNSKSAFYTTFKKITGQSPSAYRSCSKDN